MVAEVSTQTDQQEEEQKVLESNKESNKKSNNESNIESTMTAVKIDLMKLNVQPFDGDDFTMWKWRMMNLLTFIGLASVIKSKEKVVTDGQKNQFNIIMMQALSSRQLLHIIHLDSPFEQWSKLLELHESTSADRLRQLTAEFFRIRMEAADELTSFLAKVKDLMAKLKDLGEPIKDTMAIACILDKLLPVFASFVVSWNQQESGKQTLSSLESKLLQEGTRLQGSCYRVRDPSMVMATGISSNHLRDFVCWYCGEKGHRKFSCLKFIEDKQHRCLQNDKIKPGEGSRPAAAMSAGVM